MPEQAVVPAQAFLLKNEDVTYSPTYRGGGFLAHYSIFCFITYSVREQNSLHIDCLLFFT